MKVNCKRVLVLLVVILTLGTLSSCNFLIGVFNHMNIDGTRYDLDDLYLEEYGLYDGMFEFALDIVSNGIDVTSTSYSGSGDQLYLAFLSSAADIENGTYRYSQIPGGTITLGGGAAVGVDYNIGGYEELYLITGGSVELRKTLLDGFVVEFDLRAEEQSSGRSVDITGRFRGNPTDTFDYSGFSAVGKHSDSVRERFELFQ